MKNDEVLRMKKFCTLILILSFCTVFTSGCSDKPKKKNMIQSKRRFENYVKSENSSQNSHFVDLSEGPRQNYDATLGPKNLDFDIKIVDPY